MKRGTQIVYVPTHAEGDVNHKDCERGFVLWVRPPVAGCRYWSNYLPGWLRTQANSEVTSLDRLVEMDSVPQSKVDAWIESYETGYQDERLLRTAAPTWAEADEQIRNAYLSGRRSAQTDRLLRCWPEYER